MGGVSLGRVDETSIDAVARYVQSNIAIDTGSALSERIEHALLFLRYRGILREIKAGVSSTLAFFSETACFCRNLADRSPPPALAELVSRIDGIARSVLDVPAENRSLLAQDRALRSRLRPSILEALELLGQIDALNSMASASTAPGWNLPELVNSESFVLEAEGIFHPFIRDPVVNPCRLNGGEPMVFLTGPNMAGKTTYLRSVAIVVLLAQVGMAVPARQVRVSPVEALFTSLNPIDNLRAGLSYFYAEVMRVKAAATILAEGRRAFVMFDEVFKGTNVRDALDASAEVILGFAKARQSGFIFSSHLTELVGALQENRAIRFYCFDGEIRDGAAEYSYQLRQGVSAKRFGLLLLRQAGVPKLIEMIGA
jgi:DNA mismatch repair ATPase MutS